MQMSFNMTISNLHTHLLLLLLLLFPNICFGNDAIEHKTTSALFYYNAEASISYQDAKGREHRVVSWLPMTLHVSFNNGSFAYKTYPGIVIKMNNGSFSNIYRRDLFINNTYIQSLWIRHRMYFDLLKTAYDFAQLTSKNIDIFNTVEHNNKPAYQFLLEHKWLSVEDKRPQHSRPSRDERDSSRHRRVANSSWHLRVFCLAST